MEEPNIYIPNLCKNSSVLLLVILVEILAVSLSLIVYKTQFLAHLGLISMYLQWCFLVSALLLCVLRKQLDKFSYIKNLILALSCCLAPFLFVEIGSQWALGGFSSQTIDWGRVGSYFIVATLLSLTILRFFNVLELLYLRGQAESQSRVDALQSKIQPHFLFNSLNTISELTNINPEHAEKAISNLSVLFRASLENNSAIHTLKAEISLCHRYLELERWRLGDKLKVNWANSIQEVDKWSVPKLILQPVIENAVLHGQTKDGEVNISVDMKESAKHISIMVTNHKDSSNNFSRGNGIAIDNIKERLFVLYDDNQSFKVRSTDTDFQVIIRLPKST